MHTSQSAWRDVSVRSPSRNFAFLLSKPNIRILPTLAPLRAKKGNDFHGWAIYADGGTRFADGETLAGWGAVARSPHGRVYIMFCPVITTEAHLEYAGARIHYNNTAELSTWIGALYFLGPARLLIYSAKHAASICLGTIQSRANVAVGPYMSASFGTKSVKGTVHHGAHLQSCAEHQE